MTLILKLELELECLTNSGIAEEATKLQKADKEKDKEIKLLEAELKRKEKALAETATLIVLREKAQAIQKGGIQRTNDKRLRLHTCYRSN